MKVPDIDLLSDTYEDFLKYKFFSFSFFAMHPYFMNYFDPADIKDVDQAVENRKQSEKNTNTAVTFSVIFTRSYLFRSRPVFELTSSRGFRSLVMNFFIFPAIISHYANTLFFIPLCLKKID